MKTLLVVALLCFLSRSLCDAELAPARDYITLPAGVNFSFEAFLRSDKNRLRLGNDAVFHERNPIIDLTPVHGAEEKGKIFYKDPLRLNSQASSKMFSFSTSFTFAIKPHTAFHLGDGLAFVLAQDPNFQGDGGGQFSIFKGSHAPSPTVAVEFDTFRNDHLLDIDENHVGIDVNRPFSSVSASASPLNISLQDGRPITAWIDYDSHHRDIQIRLSYNTTKPRNALVRGHLDLSAVLTREVWVGFSASSNSLAHQSHQLINWRFEESHHEANRTHRRPRKVGGMVVVDSVAHKAKRFWMSYGTYVIISVAAGSSVLVICCLRSTCCGECGSCSRSGSGQELPGPEGLVSSPQDELERSSLQENEPPRESLVSVPGSKKKGGAGEKRSLSESLFFTPLRKLLRSSVQRGPHSYPPPSKGTQEGSVIKNSRSVSHTPDNAQRGSKQAGPSESLGSLVALKTPEESGLTIHDDAPTESLSSQLRAETERGYVQKTDGSVSRSLENIQRETLHDGPHPKSLGSLLAAQQPTDSTQKKSPSVSVSQENKRPAYEDLGSIRAQQKSRNCKHQRARAVSLHPDNDSTRPPSESLPAAKTRKNSRQRNSRSTALYQENIQVGYMQKETPESLGLLLAAKRPEGLVRQRESLSLPHPKESKQGYAKRRNRHSGSLPTENKKGISVQKRPRSVSLATEDTRGFSSQRKSRSVSLAPAEKQKGHWQEKSPFESLGSPLAQVGLLQKNPPPIRLVSTWEKVQRGSVKEKPSSHVLVSFPSETIPEDSDGKRSQSVVLNFTQEDLLERRGTEDGSSVGDPRRKIYASQASERNNPSSSHTEERPACMSNDPESKELSSESDDDKNRGSESPRSVRNLTMYSNAVFEPQPEEAWHSQEHSPASESKQTKDDPAHTANAPHRGTSRIDEVRESNSYSEQIAMGWGFFSP